MCSGMANLPSAYPLRDLFDAAVRYSAVRLTCPRCRHYLVFRSAALWWLFQRKGWQDRFPNVRRRYFCQTCWKRHGVKIHADIALVNEEPTDDSLPLPAELDWKRERRRRR
jgi:hypothetical protein